MSEDMNMQENARLVLGLRAAGWSEKKINDFLLYIETGDDRYKPTPDKEPATARRWKHGNVTVQARDWIKIHRVLELKKLMNRYLTIKMENRINGKLLVLKQYNIF